MKITNSDKEISSIQKAVTLVITPEDAEMLARMKEAIQCSCDYAPDCDKCPARGVLCTLFKSDACIDFEDLVGEHRLVTGLVEGGSDND